MIRTEDISQGRVEGHVAHAERPRGGVLILPTITAVDPPMKEFARLLAEAGYTAMVWNPYPGEAPPPDTNAAHPRAIKLSDDGLDAMSACVSHLTDTLRLPAVAVMGFCLGGRYAVLLAAKDKRLRACVAYYPSIRVPNQPNQTLDALALAADIQCPVHLIHGTADQVFLHSVFLKLRDVLDARPAPTFVQVHPEAVHSFMRPDLRKVAANDRAARLSWPPVMGFLDVCMRQAG
jgi:carboxymethylenebutenolidase